MTTNWHRHALCAGLDPDLFFHSLGRTPWQEARNICQQCPVTDDCLDDALEMEAGVSVRYRYGFRGGISPEERARYERRRAA